MLPDWHKARFVVEFLLNLVQQVLALLAVALHRLLLVPGVTLGVLDPGLRSLAVDKGTKARGGIAEGPAAMERQVFERLLPMRRKGRSPLHGADLDANAHGREIIRHGLHHPGKVTIAAHLARIEAVGMASFFQQLPGRSEEHTSELQSRQYLVCRLLLEKKKKIF